RPRSSVPIGCAADGGWRGGATEANGSPGAMRPARSATARSPPVMPKPRGLDRLLQLRRARGLAMAWGARRLSDRSLETDAGIEPDIGEVGEKIGEDDRRGHHEEDPEKYGIVPGQQRGEQEMSDTRPGEDGLHEHGA